MKKFWKILGLGALVVGLTPYKVEKNEETGENSYQALLWRISSAPGEGENKRAIDINLGEGTLTSKLMGGAKKAEEPHLFSDELCVEYTGGIDTAEESAEKAVEAVEKTVEETIEATEEVAEEIAETVEEAAQEAVEPEEPAEEEPKAE